MARPANNVVWLYKVCSMCKQEKYHTEFYKNPLRPGMKAECIDCNKEYKKKYTKAAGHTVIPTKVVPLEKSCSKCGEIKSHTEFYKGKGRLTSQCKVCRDADLKEYNRNNPSARDKYRRGELCRSYNFKKLYGITLEDVRKMHENQMGLCANRACGKEIFVDANRHDKKEAKNKAFVDHCHATGKVRGLLCIGCNTALGHLENRNNLVGLAEYLHKNGNNNLFNFLRS